MTRPDCTKCPMCEHYTCERTAKSRACADCGDAA